MGVQCWYHFVLRTFAIFCGNNVAVRNLLFLYGSRVAIDSEAIALNASKSYLTREVRHCIWVQYTGY